MAETPGISAAVHALDVERVTSKVPGEPPESWFAVCECGWRGHPRFSASEAVSDFGAHS